MFVYKSINKLIYVFTRAFISAQMRYIHQSKCLLIAATIKLLEFTHLIPVLP